MATFWRIFDMLTRVVGEIHLRATVPLEQRAGVRAELKRSEWERS